MEKTPSGTSVGVDDPYEFAGVCEYLTGDGRCRYAYEFGEHDPAFARERAREDFECFVVDPEHEYASSPEPEPTWGACPHYRSRTDEHVCVRCGLEERRISDAHADSVSTPTKRPLLEEHHLSYARDGETLSHEITVMLCRWCHAKVHNSWARITDDVAPDPAALAAKESRRSAELEEAAFQTAAERTAEREDSDAVREP